MLILILIDVQYLQNVSFSFEKGPYGQSHSSSDTHHPIKIPPPAKFPNPPFEESPCTTPRYLENPARHISKGPIVHIFLKCNLANQKNQAIKA